MATSEPKSGGVFDFLARTSNLVGSGVGIGALAAGAVISHSALLAVGFAVVGYASGFLLSSNNKQEISIGSHSNNEVELATIQKNIAELKATLAEQSGRISDDILDGSNRIFEILEEILPKWNKLETFASDKFTVNSILTDYLPTIITNYINLPKSYYKNANKKQLGQDITEQIDILYTSLEKIRDNLYEGVENDIKVQSMFLKKRFATEESALTLDFKKA